MIVALVSVSLLTGCTEMNSKFDCPMKPGICCESIDQINSRVDAGQFGAEITTPIYTPIDYKDMSSNEKAVGHQSILNKNESTHVWIAPYVDDEGNFHSSHHIDTGSN